MAEKAVDRIIERITSALGGSREIAAAFLFGSAVTGRLTAESDIDVAIYFAPEASGNNRMPLELEDENLRYPQEDEIWGRLEVVLGRKVDLVVLNRASATLAASVVLTGIPCFANDKALADRFARAVVTLAEDFRSFTDDFARIRARSQSLSEIDAARLVRILDFLELELADKVHFVGLSRVTYVSDSALRRNVERWVENLVNTSIDIAKIVLASQKLPMPQTYRETLSELEAVPGFEGIARELASFSRVRNLLAHEYLDMRYPEIQKIVDRSTDLYGTLVSVTRDWMVGQKEAT